jgi:hypothetical protein
VSKILPNNNTNSIFNAFWLNILPMGIIHAELHVVVANNYGLRK